jgi:hypothetical protein
MTMLTVLVPAQLTVEHLMAAVKLLSPAELREFAQQFAAWQEKNGAQADKEAALVQATNARLPIADERRLKRLIAKSERGTLTPKELDEYRLLAQRTEQLNVTRVEAFAEIVRRRGNLCRWSWRKSGGRATRMARKAIPRAVRQQIRLCADDRCEC